MNYNGKKFKPISNSENGQVSSEMTFLYFQNGNIVSSTYSGVNIVSGHLLGQVDDQGNIEMTYHHINTEGELMTGICKSKPEIMPNGKIRLYEEWQWTNGDRSHGTSILEEVL